MRFYSHFQFYFIKVFSTFFRFRLTVHFKCGQNKYRSENRLGHVAHLGHGLKNSDFFQASTFIWKITLPWNGTLTECKGAIDICKSTTVIFWINCQFETVMLFNTKFQSENSVLPLHQSHPPLYSIAKVNFKFYLPTPKKFFSRESTITHS